MTVKNPDEQLCLDQMQPFSVVLQTLCRPLLNGEVNLNIHADDEMLHFFVYTQKYPFEQATAIYLESGRIIWHTLRQIIAWRFGSLTAGIRLLDFASGYGRVTRHIVAEVPPEQVWVADIYAAGVAFQERQLAVHGVVSATDPLSVELPSGFDCIVVSSLFTHLPAARFTGWLRRLGQALAPAGGMLLFSVHDLSLRRPATSAAQGRTAVGDTAQTAAGMVFEPLSESGSLAAQEYGTAWVSESFVRAAVAETLGDCAVYRIPRGLASFQDLYIVILGGGTPPDFSRLHIERIADGFVEHCSRPGKRRLLLSGWISDRVTGQPPTEVRLRIDGLLVAASRDLAPRAFQLFAADPAAVLGWRVEADLPAAADSDLARVAISALSSAGEEIELFADSLVGALLRSAQVEVFLLDRAQTDAAGREASLQNTNGTLVQRIRDMEASRFWKLRNAWFAVKRALGLVRP